MKRETVTTPTGPREEVLLLGCYVDDLFTLYSHDDKYSLYHRFTTDLQKRWEVEDEGEVEDLLNVEISREGSQIVLRQTGYIESLVKSYLPDGLSVVGSSGWIFSFVPPIAVPLRTVKFFGM